MKIKASSHALYRYIQRSFDFDWTALEAEYRAEMGKKATGSPERQAKFMGWCWRREPELMAFYDRMLLADICPDGIATRKRLSTGQKVVIDRECGVIISVYE